jgi:septum formation protein
MKRLSAGPLSGHFPPVILASASPRRQALLAELNVPFEVLPAHTPESAGEHLTPQENCLLNAYRKARWISKQHPDALVLGADTEVCLGPRIFGKPANLDQAREFLTALSGRTHTVITGVCLLHLRRHRERLFAVSTRVTFHTLSPATIDLYLQHVHTLDKAGAYGIQDQGQLIVRKISGSYSNVVGLPLEQLRKELRRFRLPRIIGQA